MSTTHPVTEPTAVKSTAADTAPEEISKTWTPITTESTAAWITITKPNVSPFALHRFHLPIRLLTEESDRPTGESSSMPSNLRTWVPVHLPKNASWTPDLWIQIIGLMQDLHLLMLLGPFSANSNVFEYAFKSGFLSFAISLQAICQYRGSFVHGRRLVEAAWVARMSTFLVKECSVSRMKAFNECHWQTQAYEAQRYWSRMSNQYTDLEVQSHFDGATSNLSELSGAMIQASMVQTLNMDHTHPAHLLIKASFFSFALSGRTYELNRSMTNKERKKAMKFFRLRLAVPLMGIPF